MIEQVVYETVDWHAMTDDMHPYYRHCDLCQRGADDDVVTNARAGKRVTDLRGFTVIHGGDDNGLCICDRCIEQYLPRHDASKPEVKTKGAATWTRPI